MNYVQGQAGSSHCRIFRFRNLNAGNHLTVFIEIRTIQDSDDDDDENNDGSKSWSYVDEAVSITLRDVFTIIPGARAATLLRARKCWPCIDVHTRIAAKPASRHV